MFFIAVNFFVKLFGKPPEVLSVDETMEKIVREGLSVARFGDGEIKLAGGKDISFQPASQELSARLREVLKVDDEGFLPCIISFFEPDPDFTDVSNGHWIRHMKRFRYLWYRYTDSSIVYGNAFVSRFYLSSTDKSTTALRFEKMKQIWKDRDLIIVEGSQSRIGVGNDLFDNVRSVKRILCPVTAAFDRYGEILDAALGQRTGNELYLLALGPAATVLAYDLFRAGAQAVDFGHLDIEYEWFLSGATEKQPVKNKYVNEAGAGRGVGEETDEKYVSEIAIEIK